MTLKNKVALSYLLPLLLSYVGVIAALSAGSGPFLAELVVAALPASAILVACHLLQDVLGKAFKEFVVFYRASDRLPGHRAFTEVCNNDPRVPTAFLTEKLNTVGEDGAAQNAEWYSLYRGVSKEGPVEHENFRYLAWRDATSTLTLLALATPVCRAIGVLTWGEALWVGLGCLVISLFTAAAARNAAHSLVRNVVAIAATGPDQTPME